MKKCRCAQFDAFRTPLYSTIRKNSRRFYHRTTLAAKSSPAVVCGVPSPPSTAYHETAKILKIQLREAELDHGAFEIFLSPCELSTCRATCCHDGAILSGEEAATVSGLLKDHPAAFPGSNPAPSPSALSAHGGQYKTTTRPAQDHECAPDFPAHFPRTRCLFLDHEFKCSLQLHSVRENRHPWFYKPISCWMHPILLQAASSPSGRPLLTLRSPATDPTRFASCTHCGRPDSAGRPAHEVLTPELEFLSQIAGRNFLAELRAPPLSP